jgi:hypothetical protein
MVIKPLVLTYAIDNIVNMENKKVKFWSKYKFFRHCVKILIDLESTQGLSYEVLHGMFELIWPWVKKFSTWDTNHEGQGGSAPKLISWVLDHILL